VAVKADRSSVVNERPTENGPTRSLRPCGRNRLVCANNQRRRRRKRELRVPHFSPGRAYATAPHDASAQFRTPTVPRGFFFFPVGLECERHSHRKNRCTSPDHTIIQPASPAPAEQCPGPECKHLSRARSSDANSVALVTRSTEPQWRQSHAQAASQPRPGQSRSRKSPTRGKKPGPCGDRLPTPHNVPVVDDPAARLEAIAVRRPAREPSSEYGPCSREPLQEVSTSPRRLAPTSDRRFG